MFVAGGGAEGEPGEAGKAPGALRVSTEGPLLAVEQGRGAHMAVPLRVAWARSQGRPPNTAAQGTPSRPQPWLLGAGQAGWPRPGLLLRAVWRAPPSQRRPLPASPPWRLATGSVCEGHMPGVPDALEEESWLVFFPRVGTQVGRGVREALCGRGALGGGRWWEGSPSQRGAQWLLVSLPPGEFTRLLTAPPSGSPGNETGV